jgi:hypothetical protein
MNPASIAGGQRVPISGRLARQRSVRQKMEGAHSSTSGHNRIMPARASPPVPGWKLKRRFLVSAKSIEQVTWLLSRS